MRSKHGNYGLHRQRRHASKKEKSASATDNFYRQPSQSTKERLLQNHGFETILGGKMRKGSRSIFFGKDQNHISRNM